MKLEYDEEGKKYFKHEFISFFIMITVYTCVLAYLIINVIFYSGSIFFTFMELLLLSIFIGLNILMFRVGNNWNRNVIDSSFIEKGEKRLAYIVGAEEVRRRRHVTRYKLLISFEENDRLIDIIFVYDNKAFELLKLLLNPYPIKEIVKIPIDTYIYKNKVYADLESVDFTKIKGYEECVKVLDKLYKIE